MKVVVVDWDVAFPMNSGKRLRTLNLMLHLADRHEITYFSRASGSSAEGVQTRQFLASHGIKSVFADLPLPVKSGWTYFSRHAANLLRRDPVAVMAHLSRKLAVALRDYAQCNQVDLWQLEWTPYVDMLQGIIPLRTVIVAHNVDSIIWQRYHETESNPLRRWLIKDQWRKFVRFEKAAFNRATRVIAVSNEDATLLRNDFGVEHVDVVANGVDITSYQSVSSQRNPRELLFLGSLDWRPNQDAVSQLLKEIYPQVLRAEPEARLTLVGRRPPAWISERVAKLPGVELCADVSDVRPYLARAGMMVVPLRIGGGSRLKILESLANGLPVVATRVAAEGLLLAPGVDYENAETSETMSAVIVNWIRHPQIARASARNGQQVVTAHYGWDKLAKELEAVWEKTASQPLPLGA